MDIRVDNLHKSYGIERVLEAYSGVFKEGQVNFILGNSGIGKTSLIRILMGLESYTSGEIRGLEDKVISAVFQENALIENLSVALNISLVNEKLDISTIEKELDRLGLSSVINKRVRDLSGGMKRRVVILRALLYEFDLLLMDEPFKALDTLTKKIVMDFVMEKTANKTLIIVTHDLEEVDYFRKQVPNRVLVNTLD